MKTILAPTALRPCFSKDDAIAPPSRPIRTKLVLMSLAIALGVVFLPQGALAQQGNVLNYTVSTAMTNTGVDADARGTINSALSRNGNGDNQRLKIVLGNLAPNTAYQLNAFVHDDIAPTVVAAFTTDNRGAFVISYAKNRLGKANAGTQLLPASLDPLCIVRELQIVNGSAQTVLQALLPVSSGGHYVVSRPLQNSGFISAAAATLRITAPSRLNVFRLLASGLTPATDYVLSVNGGTGQTLTSDSAGKLKLMTLPQGISNPLDIHSLALSDTSGNLVLSTEGIGLPCNLAPAPGRPGTPVNLRSAAGFAVLAGSTVTSSGFSIVNDGDVGVSAGTAVDGFPPAVINNGAIHSADTAAAQAQLDLTTAYNDAAGRTVRPVSVAGNLGGQTLIPGLYKSTSSLEISSGDLTLDARGNAHAVFIFQIASTLTTTSDRKILLTGNARAANVFWQVGTSATLGTLSVFKGTILADQSITLTSGATLEGRALARIGGVTLGESTVTVPAP
jgi:hypothetical protein